MLETSNYKLKKYQPTDSPDLLTGYNKSMDTIDAQIKSTNARSSQRGIHGDRFGKNPTHRRRATVRTDSQ